MGRPPKDKSTKGSFSVPANILQEQSGNETVRKLNEEFRDKGGVVRFKSTTKGQSIKLSHPDQEYLDGFRHRLLKELGLLEEEEEGKDDGPGKKTEGGAEGEKPDSADKKKEGHPPPQEEPYIRQSSGDDQRVIELIEEAVNDGAIDDGQVIKYSYSVKAPDKVIQLLRKKLWSNKCRLVDKKCRFKRKQINFEETMKSCTGVRNECEFCDSDLLFLFPKWKQNVDDMFLEYVDKPVRVRGKISYAKYVERDEGYGNHFKFLIYDTMVNNQGDRKNKKPKETRKLWARLSEDDFNKMNKKQKFMMEDIVDIKGTVVWNEFFYDYWIEDITDMKVHESKGEMPIKA